MIKKFSYRISHTVNGHPGWVGFIFILLVLFSVLTFLPPFVVHYQLQKALKEQGAEQVKIQEVTFNPFTFTLRIHSLFAQGEEAGHIEWRRMAFNVNVWPLENKRIVIENLILHDASFTIQRTAGGEMIFGGMRLQPTPQKSKPGAIQVGFRNIDLKNVKIIYSGPLIKQTVFISSAKVDKFLTWKLYESSNFDFRGQIEKGTVSLNGRINPKEKKLPFSIHLEVDTLPLMWLAPILAKKGFQGFSSILNINLIVKGKGGPDLRTLNSSGYFNLTNLSSTIPSLPYSLSVSKISYNGDAMLTPGGLIKLGNDLVIDDLFIRDTSQNLVVLNSNSISLQKISADGTKVIVLNKARISDLRSLAYYTPGNLLNTGPASLHLDSFTIDSVSVTDNLSQLTVNAASLKALTIDIIRDHDSIMRVTKQLAPLSLIKPNIPIQFSINQLQIDGNSAVHFQDLSTNPITELNASEVTFKLKNSYPTGQPSPGQYTLNSKIAPLSNLDAQGTIGPLSPEINMTVIGVIDQFNLPSISPYLRTLFGYKLSTGMLSLSTDGSITNSKLSLNNNISISNISITPDKSAPAYRKFKDIFLGISLKGALSMLTDRKKNVKLSIPVSGDLSDPKFHFGDVVVTALNNGLIGGLNSVFADIGNFLGPSDKLTFAPILFDPGSKALIPKNQTHLQKVARILLNNSKTQINLCGKAVFPDRKTEKGPISRVEQRDLLNLATARSRAVKVYLTSKQVPTSQLFLCVPEIDSSEDAKPRVEIRSGSGEVK